MLPVFNYQGIPMDLRFRYMAVAHAFHDVEKKYPGILDNFEFVNPHWIRCVKNNLAAKLIDGGYWDIFNRNDCTKIYPKFLSHRIFEMLDFIIKVPS
jgi:hypothetical protein